jgi:hypothetical protein
VAQDLRSLLREKRTTKMGAVSPPQPPPTTPPRPHPRPTRQQSQQQQHKQRQQKTTAATAVSIWEAHSEMSFYYRLVPGAGRQFIRCNLSHVNQVKKKDFYWGIFPMNNRKKEA